MGAKRKQWVTIRLVVLVLSVGMAVFAWNAPGGNPRDGWSLAKIKIGAEPMPGSGTRAYQITNASPMSAVRIETEQIDALGYVLVLRNRVGAFFPWSEKTYLRLVVPQDSIQFESGNQAPLFHELLREIRPQYVRYVETRGDWHQRYIDGIDAELAGTYPATTVHKGMLILDIAGVVSHLLVFLIVLLFMLRL